MRLFWVVFIFLTSSVLAATSEPINPKPIIPAPITPELIVPKSMKATVEIVRVADALWRAEYCFDTPVEMLKFGRPIKAMRATHWSTPTKGLNLTHTDGTAQLQPTVGGTFSCGIINIIPFTDLPDEADYYVFTPFSDGSMTLFTGHLVPTAYIGGVWYDVDFTATYKARSGERVVAAEPDKLGYQFVYFGALAVVETKEAILIIDPIMPASVREKILTGLTKTNALLPKVFGYRVPDKYQIFMAASNLEKNNGTSIKGGALSHQIRFTLVGRGTLRLAETQPLFYPKLAVHETLHLWQNDVWLEQLSGPRQWVHEGGADAIAYEIMRLSGLYDAAAYTSKWQSVEQNCAKLLGSTSVHGGTEAGYYDVFYECGAFANYLVGAALNQTDPGAGILIFWKAMAAWDKEIIMNTDNEGLFFLTMKKLGLRDVQEQALRLFLSEQPDNPEKAIASIKRVFGVMPSKSPVQAEAQGAAQPAL